MRLVFDIIAGLAACGAAYYLARGGPSKNAMAPEIQRRAEAGHREAPRSPSLRSPAIVAPLFEEHSDAEHGVAENRAMSTLRNEVIRATAEDMYRRGEDVMKCLGSVQLSGEERIRFSVEVVATTNEATVGQWRFVEIVEGQPLPDTFASCAAHALGGGLRVMPREGFHFSPYKGELTTLYTIPAPRR